MASWDIALLVVAGYLAVVTLVKLMVRRRDHTVGKLRQLMGQELARTRSQRNQQGQADRRDEAA